MFLCCFKRVANSLRWLASDLDSAEVGRAATLLLGDVKLGSASDTVGAALFLAERFFVACACGSSSSVARPTAWQSAAATPAAGPVPAGVTHACQWV